MDRLVQQVDMLREQISMYEYQLRSQSEWRRIEANVQEENRDFFF